MSAVNVFISPDGRVGHMLTDSRAQEEVGGGAACHWPKVVAVPHAHTVVAVRGHSTHVFFALASAGKFNTFDQVAAEWAPNAKLLWAASRPQIPYAPEFYVMGWSESAKRVRAFMSTAEPDFVPQFSDAMCAPGYDPELVTRHDSEGPLTWSDPPASLLRVMRMQRAEAATGTGACYGIIGGEAVLTTLTRDRIEQRVVHSWSDE